MEQHVAGFAARLGAVERDVGVAEQVAGRRPITGRDADARGDDEWGASLERDRLGQGIDQSLGDDVGPLLDRLALDEYDELIATEPADRVALPQRVGQPTCYGAQQSVTGGVPERVIHVLEVVEVDEQHRRGTVLATRSGEHLLDSVENQDPVGQPRQRIVQWLVSDLVKQACVANRGGRLTREPAQSVSDVGVLQALRPFGENRNDSPDLFAIGDDRHGGGRYRFRFVEDRLDQVVARLAGDEFGVKGVEMVGRWDGNPVRAETMIVITGVAPGRGDAAGARGQVVQRDYRTVAIDDHRNRAREFGCHLLDAHDV